MAHNVEIKARVCDVVALIEHAAIIVDSGPECIKQDDTFFACTNGRLKLWQLLPGRGELIHYLRANSTGLRVSSYHITPTNVPDALRDTLTAIIGAAGRVTKVCQLYLAGRTRIHVDAAKDLGNFVELEVALCEGRSKDDGMAIAHALMQSLGIAESDLFGAAYADLLAIQ